MNLSFKQYRAVDLTIMLVMLVAAEVIIVVAAGSWFPNEIYVLSPTVAVICIVMMRWGPYAAIHAVAGGAALCIVMGASVQQFAVYCIGNCFSLLGLVMFRALGKERIRSKMTLTALFTLAVFAAVQVGRWAVSLLFGGAPESIGTFFASDSLSLLFALVTVQLARRLDGIFEDQKAYLIRTEAQRRREDFPDAGDSEYGE